MARIIEVVVTPNGETTIETKGYAGGECLQASKFLEQALGDITQQQHTSEYFQSAAAEQQLKQ